MLLLSMTAFADAWYFRGTPNSWGTTAMTSVGTNLWETTQDFTGNSSPAFKISHYTNWTEAYPSSNYNVTAKKYKITFNSSTKAITATIVSGPTVSASPAGGTFATVPVTVTLSVGVATSGKYTLDGTDPATSATAKTYTNGTQVSVGGSLAPGASATLKLYAISGTTAVTSYTFTRAPVVTDKWYFRGTPNNWAATEMTLVSGTKWQTVQDFTGNTNPRFKIDHKADWTEAYPSADFVVAAKKYTISFDSSTKAITVTELVGPSVDASPAGGSFTTVPVSVTLAVKVATAAKYTTDGTDPATSATAKSYSDGTVISIGSGLANNASATLKLYVLYNGVTDTKTYTYTKVAPTPAPSFSWRNALVYFVIQDRFYNGDTTNDTSYGRVKTDAYGKNIGTFHGGDVKGLTAKLNEGYFTNLGVNAIWITAAYEQMHGFCGGGNSGDFAHYAYHGYYPLDYTTMDKNMGTVTDMRTFVDTAHAKGIRVVMDVVMNHAAYDNIKDMEEYGYGKLLNGMNSSWAPGSGQNYHSYHSNIDYNDTASWAKWWGPGWIRYTSAGGYTNGGSDDLTKNLDYLPDFKTEVTSNMGLAPILATKWSKETSGYENWIIPAAAGLRKDLGVAPADYQIKWLAAWVKEFGIDGFRCDTAKHVDMYRWGQLKSAADTALKQWRAANPTKAGATWTDNFWMTGEVWGHGVNKDSYFSNGFDSIINFTFPKDGNIGSIGSTWQSYANTINSDTSFNVLSYVSSHDTGLSRSNTINLGTALVLSPGGAQIYYGDETARAFGATGSDSNQGTRSDMNFGGNPTVLAHWQKLGKFRNAHLSVGAGTQIDLGNNTYGRVYSVNGVDDRVVINVNGSGSVAVNVSSVFPDGTAVRNSYDGQLGTVSGGKVTFTASNGVILIEKQ